MRILNLFRRTERRGQRDYKEFAHNTGNPSALVAGKPEDRLRGLDRVLAYSQGKTVLDVGCHDGTVAQAFHRSGAARVDGCDIFTMGVERTRKLVPSGKFVQCDLSRGADYFRSLGFALEYDIVCYLGMQHHLSRQMQPDDLDDLVFTLAGMAKSVFVLRTPQKYVKSAEDVIRSAGFRLHESEGTRAIIYKRKD